MTVGFRPAQPVAVLVAQPVASASDIRSHWSGQAEGVVRPTAHLNSSIIHVFRAGDRP